MGTALIVWMVIAAFLLIASHNFRVGALNELNRVNDSLMNRIVELETKLRDMEVKQ